MEDRKWIHPTRRWGNVDDPSAKVAAPRVGLLQKNHRLGDTLDGAQLGVPGLGSGSDGRSLPLLPVHAVGFGVTVVSPPTPRPQCLGSQVARTVVHAGGGNISIEGA